MRQLQANKMQENKGCRTNAAPPGPNHTTSSDNCNDRPPDPKAEGMKLVATSRIHEDGGSKRCRQTKGAQQKQPRPSRTKQIMQERGDLLSWSPNKTRVRADTRTDPKHAVTLRKSASKEIQIVRGCRGTKGARARTFGIYLKMTQMGP